MAKQQRKEPWNSRVNRNESYNEPYNESDNADESEPTQGRASRPKTNSASKDGTASTVFLAVLVFFMFAIIGGAIFFTIWNNRNPNMKSVQGNFYPAAASSSSKTSTASSSLEASTTANSTDTSSSSSASNTYTYQGESSIADIVSNAGVSWATLCKYNSQLNPNWGNPNFPNAMPNKDGTYLKAGTVLKTGN